MGDSELMIEQFQKALDELPENHPFQADRLTALGLGYEYHYSRTTMMADLEMAMQHYQSAVNKTPDNSKDLAGRLRRLGNAYGLKYHKTGSRSDLDIATWRAQEAVNLIPENHPERGSYLHDLGIIYGIRYNGIGALADLEMAIYQFREALDKTPENSIHRGDRFRTLGVAYLNKYQRTNELSDLEIAIQQFQHALNLAPEYHPDRARRLNSLGVAYQNMFKFTGKTVDLETALQLLQDAVDTPCENRVERVNFLQDLGLGYGSRYQVARLPGDLDMAIQKLQESLDLTPDNYPHRATILHALGNKYRDRYKRTRASDDLQSSIQRHHEALNHSSSSIRDRLKNVRDWFSLYTEVENWSMAYEDASTAVSLIIRLAPRSLDNFDKQHLLAEVAGLASDATAAAIHVHKTTYAAVQLLELGRGIIIGALDNLRPDLSKLEQMYPKLAEEFVTSRNQLTNATFSMQQADQRYNASQKLEETIQAIQKLPEFHRFLLPPSEDELKEAAVFGPIVIINVSIYRCDALIIETTGLKTMPLPDLRSSDILTRSKEPVSLDLLQWLWKTTAKPVLDALGFAQIPLDGKWPHIWWVPTGPLTKIPIHAAGYHIHGTFETVLDRVISSYGSSVKALIQSRRRRRQAPSEQELGKAVLVGMQELQYAPEEIEKLEAICHDMHLHVSKPLTCQKEVLSALGDCSIFHFAGHGNTDLSSPLKSALILSDGPLAVASLFETNLPECSPFLAYLSACGTGRIRQDKFMDEGLHLIAAYQIVGFRHVIGTLWEVDDELCVNIAIKTYKWIQQRGMSDESVSEGLHFACRATRDEWASKNPGSMEDKTRLDEEHRVASKERFRSEARNHRDIGSCDDMPLYWVPYVHFGA